LLRLARLRAAKGHASASKRLTRLSLSLSLSFSVVQVADVWLTAAQRKRRKARPGEASTRARRAAGDPSNAAAASASPPWPSGDSADDDSDCEAIAASDVKREQELKAQSMRAAYAKAVEGLGRRGKGGVPATAAAAVAPLLGSPHARHHAAAVSELQRLTEVHKNPQFFCAMRDILQEAHGGAPSLRSWTDACAADSAPAQAATAAAAEEEEEEEKKGDRLCELCGEEAAVHCCSSNLDATNPISAHQPHFYCHTCVVGQGMAFYEITDKVLSFNGCVPCGIGMQDVPDACFLGIDSILKAARAQGKDELIRTAFHGLHGGMRLLKQNSHKRHRDGESAGEAATTAAAAASSAAPPPFFFCASSASFAVSLQQRATTLAQAIIAGPASSVLCPGCERPFHGYSACSAVTCNIIEKKESGETQVAAAAVAASVKTTMDGCDGRFCGICLYMPQLTAAFEHAGPSVLSTEVHRHVAAQHSAGSVYIQQKNKDFAVMRIYMQQVIDHIRRGAMELANAAQAEEDRTQESVRSRPPFSYEAVYSQALFALFYATREHLQKPDTSIYPAALPIDVAAMTTQLFAQPQRIVSSKHARQCLHTKGLPLPGMEDLFKKPFNIREVVEIQDAIDRHQPDPAAAAGGAAGGAGAAALRPFRRRADLLRPGGLDGGPLVPIQVRHPENFVNLQEVDLLALGAFENAFRHDEEGQRAQDVAIRVHSIIMRLTVHVDYPMHFREVDAYIPEMQNTLRGIAVVCIAVLDRPLMQVAMQEGEEERGLSQEPQNAGAAAGAAAAAGGGAAVMPAPAYHHHHNAEDDPIVIDDD
jgi:hypothetical protein